MERKRNWLGLIGVVLGGLALVVALGGRFGPQMAYRGMGGGGMMGGYQNAAPAAPANPPARPQGRFAQGQAGSPDAFTQQYGRGAEHMGRGAQGFSQGRPPMMGRGFAQGRSFGHGHGFNPLGMLFGLVNGVSKLVALGLLGWLLLRLFQQRRDGSAHAAPTTPAGHDPRVE
jgi:hypothetical protein